MSDIDNLKAIRAQKLELAEKEERDAENCRRQLEGDPPAAVREILAKRLKKVEDHAPELAAEIEALDAAIAALGGA